MRLSFALVVAIALSSASTAFAQSYVVGSVGYVSPQDLRTSAGVRGKIKDGGAVTLAVGSSFGPIRGEVEGGYRAVKVGSVQGFGLRAAGTGKLSALSAMANAYFDPAFSLGPLKPYVGGGIGVARFQARNVSAVGLPAGLPVTSIGPLSGSKTGFAYQAMAGVGLAVGGNGALTLGYRYFATPGVTTRAPVIGDVRIRGLKTHAAEVGFRLTF
jgi:opacity protein-like surface antigen